MQHSQEIIKLLVQVKRGRQRRLILQHLTAKPIMVSELQRAVNADLEKGELPIRRSDVSRTLIYLRKLELAYCLNPPKKLGDSGILYQLTKKGEEVKKLL